MGRWVGFIEVAEVEAKEELLKLLLPHPSLREALRVPRSAQGLVCLGLDSE